ncbi:hypothetical protein ACGFI9_21790 [Micromonospora sp. NPDC048930]|uniref:hypothetical protein n=1 Tax=Micromonospora sp. NPDC048930 TaxID=3364261 RepID=UPI0037214955
MSKIRQRVVDRVVGGVADLEDRRSFDAPIRFESIETDLHVRTPDGRWSLHRRRTGDGPIRHASCWDLVDNADPRPEPVAVGTADMALAVGRARAYIRRRP